jgi:hypothetical protein
VDVPEDVIETLPNGLRRVPEGVTGEWLAWCEECQSRQVFVKTAEDVLVVDGARQPIPTIAVEKLDAAEAS